MPTLPLEVVARIVALPACDGGRTGCALAAVSRDVRRAAARARFHSVALRGPTQIRAFMRLNGRSSQTGFPTALDPPQIIMNHLFLADWPVRTRSGVLGGLASLLARNPSWRSWTTICTLLARHASTITHLHISVLMDMDLDPCHNNNVELPVLRELTLDVRDLRGLPLYRAFARSTPRLRRLHILADEECGYTEFFDADTLPPGLTHLRLSEGLDPRRILGALSARFYDRWLPPSVAVIIIAPRKPDPTDAHRKKRAETPDTRFRRAETWAKYGSEHFVWSRRRWKEAAGGLEDKVRMTIEEGAWEVDQTFRDWVERAQGRHGPWSKGKRL
jgi:hypothetical protein